MSSFSVPGGNSLSGLPLPPAVMSLLPGRSVGYVAQSFKSLLVSETDSFSPPAAHLITLKASHQRGSFQFLLHLEVGGGEAFLGGAVKEIMIFAS